MAGGDVKYSAIGSSSPASGDTNLSHTSGRLYKRRVFVIDWSHTRHETTFCGATKEFSINHSLALNSHKLTPVQFCSIYFNIYVIWVLVMKCITLHKKQPITITTRASKRHFPFCMTTVRQLTKSWCRSGYTLKYSLLMNGANNPQ